MRLEPRSIPDDVVAAVERIAGVRVASAQEVRAGYTQARKWRCGMTDGTILFVKSANDPRSRAALTHECLVYGEVVGGFLPRCIGFDLDVGVLVLEDLGDLEELPPWTNELVAAVLLTLEEMHERVAPASLPTPDEQGELRGGWLAVSRDPLPFLQLGLCSEVWLRRCIEVLILTEEQAILAGDSLGHLDIRSDNICVTEDGRCVFVDWSYAARANSALDAALWLPSLHMEGGPSPRSIGTQEMGRLACCFAGYLAVRAPLPEPTGSVLGEIRSLQLAQLRVALPWVSQALELPPPDHSPS